MSMLPMGAFFGLDLFGLVEVAANGRTYAVGHNIAGNRIRMAEQLSLSPDLLWKTEMPRSKQLATAGVSLPLL